MNAAVGNRAKEGTLRFRDVDVYVREIGSGPPVLLINGLGAHTSMWATVEQTLAGFRLLQFDLPGAGQSGVPGSSITIPDLAQLAIAVMDHFGVKRAHVIGYSMGGIVAQQLVHDAPRRVQRLVLVATSPGRGSFLGAALALINISTPMRYISARLYALTIGSLVGGRARHDSLWIADQGLLRLKHPPTWRGYLRQLQSIARWSGFPILGKISHDVLVIAGDDDPLVPVVNTMMLTHMLRKGRLLLLRNEGHLMAMDSESRLHPAIREFLGARDLKKAQVWHCATPVDVKELKIALAGVGLQALPWSPGAGVRRRWLLSGSWKRRAQPARAGA